MDHRPIRRSWILASLVVASGAAAAAADIVRLSTHATDETDPAVLDARLEFEVTGSTLTLTVHNDTAGDHQYRIGEVYFNTGNLDWDLQLTSPGLGWMLVTDTPIDRLSPFDFGLVGDAGRVMPGESLTFTFDITGSSTAADLSLFLSATPPIGTPAIAAAWFADGPDGDDAYGVYIPSPGAAAALMLLPLAGRRRRR